MSKSIPLPGSYLICDLSSTTASPPSAYRGSDHQVVRAIQLVATESRDLQLEPLPGRSGHSHRHHRWPTKVFLALPLAGLGVVARATGHSRLLRSELLLKQERTSGSGVS